MARLLPSLQTMQKSNFLTIPLPYVFALVGTFCVFSFVTFLCGSHGTSRKREQSVQLGEKSNTLAKLQSNISGKALLMVKMISWRKVQDEDEDEDEDEEKGPVGDDMAVWRKKIIMGGKCRPLDFSGNILYDSEGNLLPNKGHEKVDKVGKSFHPK